MNKANNSNQMRMNNRLHVLRLIRQSPISRAELARKTGLTRAAVTIIVDALISEKLIIEGEAVKSNSGRHPTMLQLNNTAAYSVGVDITRDGCFVCLCDFSGTLVKKEFVNFKATPEQTINSICEAINNFNKENILGIGISSPGPLDSINGVILAPPNFTHFKNFNIVEPIKEKCGLPVFLEKDTNALALAEKNLIQKSDFLYLLADHGLGGAVIKDGMLFKGANGFGCEIGHITLDYNGELCDCGNRGCASLYTSVSSISKKANKPNYEEVCSSAENGDLNCLNALKYQGEMLSHALISFVNLFEPPYIILGGELKKGISFLKPIIEENLKKRILSRNIQSINIASSMLCDRALSPAQLVLENYFLKG